MLNCTLMVQYVPNTNCFGHLNRRNIGNQLNGTCANIIWENGSVILWCVDSNVADGCIGLNALFAKQLGISEGSVITISSTIAPPALKQVTVYPSSADDLEILESNAEKVQSCLLDQLRVVVENQSMVVWVSPSLSLCIKSSKTTLLQQETEVMVKLESSATNNQDLISDCDKNENSSSNDISKPPSGNLLNFYMSRYNQTLSKYKDKFALPLCLRAVVATKAMNISIQKIFDQNQLFVIYTNDDSLKQLDNSDIYSLRCMNSNIQVAQAKEDGTDSSGEMPSDVFVKIKHISEKIQCKQLNVTSKYPSVIISKKLNGILNTDTGMKLSLERVFGETLMPTSIEIFPVLSDNMMGEDDLVTIFKMYITTQSTVEEPILINNGVIIHMSPVKNVSCQITLHPNSIKFALVNGETLRHCRVISNNIGVQPYQTSINNHDQSIDLEALCRKVKCFELIIDTCMQTLRTDTLLKDTLDGLKSSNGHILISGAPGSGKSSICNLIVSDMGVWFLRLGCRSVKGRRDIIEIFRNAIQLCEDHSPSILICDDIESIIPSESEGISHQEAIYYDTLVYAIRNMLNQCDGVSIIITAAGLDSLHSAFKVAKGEIVFTSICTIPELTQNERLVLLKHIAYNSVYSISNIRIEDFEQTALETSGLTVRDLVDTMTSKLFTAVKNAVSDNTALLFLENETRESDKTKTNNESNAWGTIGGMQDIKQVLIETVCWPIKYPGLFPKQPGGILLFGPPGTGKSLIGSSIAKLNQLSFICVKGPELLSKYIGQSEQAVRNIFEKAEKKKPCVLFFDEFDSLAPRRGHDSTGVTDRVVNQLLTQLDGVEGAIKGVTVIAATSRPDLLDGALLRPGRFDTNIHCSMPHQGDRLEILRVLSNGLQLSDDVDLEEISKLTDGFTGADIKAVLSTAQLTCVEELLEKSEAELLNTDCGVTVTRHHLLTALENTRPSLTLQQLNFYARIYARFLDKPVPVDEGRPDTFETRQRATLA